jgi:hypothetical protein
VIRVAGDAYFAVDDGVWYTATVPLGPWIVATEVPLVVYSIPISCPIHYVTYVRVYRWTPEFVWVGYTPGYLGACLAPWGTVVYGSGWYYPPWIGSVWIGAPWTFGFGVSVDWDFGFGWAISFARPFWRPWWGPVGWGWGRPRRVLPAAWRPGRPIRFTNFNVYRALPRRAVVPRAPVRPVTTMSGFRGRPVAPVPRTAPRTATRPNTLRAAPDVYAGRDGNVYRPSPGGWEHNDGRGWSRVPPSGPAVAPPAPRVEAPPIPRPSTSELTLERRAREVGSYRAAPPSPPVSAPRAQPAAPRPRRP